MDLDLHSRPIKTSLASHYLPVMNVLLLFLSLGCTLTPKANMTLTESVTPNQKDQDYVVCPHFFAETAAVMTAQLKSKFHPSARPRSAPTSNKASGTLIVCQNTQNSRLCSLTLKQQTVSYALFPPQMYFTPEHTEYLTNLFLTSRKDLHDQEIFLFDLLSENGLGCLIAYPRQPGEIFFKGTSAFALFQAFRPDGFQTAQTKSVLGSLFCRSALASGVASCWARPWMRNSSYERVQELTLRDSERISAVISQGLSDLNLSQLEPPLTEGPLDPKTSLKKPIKPKVLEIAAHIICTTKNNPSQSNNDVFISCSGKIANHPYSHQAFLSPHKITNNLH